MIYLKYLRSLLTHKWYVFVAGRKVGVPLWRLIIHDWSKFLPVEFIPYARHFYGNYPPSSKLLKYIHFYQGPYKEEVERAFDYAWNHHQKVNPHHWQYWFLIQDSDPTKALPMPETYVREMVADWMGASKAYTGSWDMHDWLRDALPRISRYMCNETLERLAYVLVEQGYDPLYKLVGDEVTIHPFEQGVTVI